MISQLAEVRDYQLQSWPLARRNYEALGMTERRPFTACALEGGLQFNPARAVSTAARVDAQSIKKRKCFLCKANRPSEQLYEEILPGWEFLVNPYPIFPLHFTIASSEHIPQSHIPVEMASMAERLPGMTVFFNGARAGASAPDHMHCQAVMTSELPLMRYLESGGGMALLNDLRKSAGTDKITGQSDSGLVNAFLWIGGDGLLRSAVVPRSAHRPACYTVQPDSVGFMVSPGSIDMAGVIILPRREDFERISSDDVIRIYSEVALPADS